MLPLRRGDTGDAVLDLQRRLTLAGYNVQGDHFTFGSGTEAALREFQSNQGLVVDGVCGPHSWNALVEADHRLGDRLLYYRSPMMRGDDIGDLQQQLGRLGFDTGWVDGIFGPETQAAVQQFQHNVGVPDDGVVGRVTVTALQRLSTRSASGRTVAEVREHEKLRQQPGQVEGRKIVVGHMGELPVIAQAVTRHLQELGAEVMSLSMPRLSRQSRMSNDWDGDIYLGITLSLDSFGISYFATTGFESAGGRALAKRCSAALRPLLPQTIPVAGMRLPILRETRMPAVWCRLGPGTVVVTKASNIAAALSKAVVDWCHRPISKRT